VGIGAGAPNRSLSISGSGVAATFANMKNGSHELLLGVDTAAVLSAMTASDLQIRTNNTTRMVVQANTGNVGIGPGAPSAPDQQLTVSMAGTDVAIFANVKSSNHELLVGVEKAAIISAKTASNLEFRTNNTPRAVIDGTNGIVTVNNALQLGNSDIYFTRTDFRHSGAGDKQGFAAIENDSQTFNALMILGRTRTVNPLLRVIQMFDDVEVTGNLTVDKNASKPGGGPWASTSDEKLKKNIRPLPSVLDKLLRLRGVSFEWKEPEKFGNLTGLQMGLVAQQVEDVFPEWVGQLPDGTKTLCIRGFEALTIEAFREIRQEIGVVKELVMELQSKLGIEAKDGRSAVKATRSSDRGSRGVPKK
jgi:hypothetical protein